MQTECRAAIFVDVEYYRLSFQDCDLKDDLLRSTTELIKRIREVCKDCPEFVFRDVTRWRCYAYDARYCGKAIGVVGSEAVRARKELHSTLRRGGFTVRLGSYMVRSSIDARGKGHIIQKEVDTALVVDAMRECWQAGTKVFFFITGDCDFIPLFTELKCNRRMTVLLYGNRITVNDRILKSPTYARRLIA